MSAAVCIDVQPSFALKLAVFPAHSADGTVAVGICIFICEGSIYNGLRFLWKVFELPALKTVDIDPLDPVIRSHGMDPAADTKVGGVFFKSSKQGIFDPVLPNQLFIFTEFEWIQFFSAAV